LLVFGITSQSCIVAKSVMWMVVSEDGRSAWRKDIGIVGNLRISERDLYMFPYFCLS